ncbi:MAG: hypothetical protein M1830_009844 [Pleopsidium flavum]|nr:MAG: hypothetical protein M1830_009844 [Pleopsidium flavum]
MEAYAHAIVGVPGEGLNVEQRKRLTIGVEMAAKPVLLLFLDEPTSGLDSQTAWSICTLLRKLANNGQAILCTIHQPSALLFQKFDQLLLLERGGRTLYFGGIGPSSETVIKYFEKNGARSCKPEENPAEWILNVTGAAVGPQDTHDWSQRWRSSTERQEIKRRLAEMKENLSLLPTEHEAVSLREFAVPITTQLYTVTRRNFEEYWRTPSYLWSKFFLCTGSAFFIGFSFWKSPNSLQGLQNQLFSIFLLLTIFSNVIQQIMPQFVSQRALYEARERPSKIYSWKVFILSSIIVELPWQTLMSAMVFAVWYYPVGMYTNGDGAQVHERGALMFLLVWAFFMFTSTFADMIVAAVEQAETAVNLAQLFYYLLLIFCGVLVNPSDLPGFWIFMYRVSPLTYLVGGMMSTGLANAEVVCSSIELLTFNSPSGQTCGDYLTEYISSAGGRVLNPDTMGQCQFCPLVETNTFLATIGVKFDNRWRDFGLQLVYIAFNICGTFVLYWLVRVPKRQKVLDQPERAKAE